MNGDDGQRVMGNDAGFHRRGDPVASVHDVDGWHGVIPSGYKRSIGYGKLGARKTFLYYALGINASNSSNASIYGIV